MSVTSLRSSPTARAAVPFAAAGFMVAISFGISARAAGMPAAAAIAMSLIALVGLRASPASARLRCCCGAARR